MIDPAVRKRLTRCNSHQRAGVMLEELAMTMDYEWFPIVLAAFPDCDDTWRHHEELLSYLRLAAADYSAEEFFDAEQATFFDRLPNRVTVYRGCSRPRVSALSWTTDPAVAAEFARGHRGIRVPDAVVASAKIDKQYIFAVFVDRAESEVLLDPDRLQNIKIGECSS